MYTGLAGSLGAIAVQFVAPDSFGVFVSIFLFVGLVVGGVSSIGGTLLGAAFIEFVPNLADKMSKAAPGAVYGVILIAVMFLMPAGAGGFLHTQCARMFSASGRPGRNHRWRSGPYRVPVPGLTACRIAALGRVGTVAVLGDVTLRCCDPGEHISGHHAGLARLVRAGLRPYP